MLPLYTDQLDNARQTVFKKLAVFAPPFVLAGGTAIMLQIGHRKSYDFDCFYQGEILADNLLRKIRRVFGNTLLVRTKIAELVTVVTPENVEVTFVCHPYPPLRPLVKTPGIPLFQLSDLAANKAYTLGRRPAWRDYVDLFFFLKWKLFTIDALIALAVKKFAGEFNPKLFLQQLVYFDDIKVVDTIFLKESYSPSEIKAFLEKSVKDYLKKVLE